MRVLRSFGSDFEAHHAAGLLRARGIPCEVRGKSLSEEPPFLPELWLLEDTDLPAAIEALDERRELPLRPWNCPRCRAEVEAQFSSCWACGAERS